MVPQTVSFGRADVIFLTEMKEKRPVDFHSVMKQFLSITDIETEILKVADAIAGVVCEFHRMLQLAPYPVCSSTGCCEVAKRF